MKTFAYPRSFAAAVGLLALALALPRAEAKMVHGAYFVSYTDGSGATIHTAAAKTPATAIERFRKAAITNTTLSAN